MQQEPDALLAVDAPVTIDEVQRVPSLLLVIKRRVDERHKPGRFLLTGSANLLLQRNISESLAGRSVYLTLLPFTCSERTGQGGCGRWTKLLQSPGSLGGTHPALTQWKEWVTTSAFPQPSLARRDLLCDLDGRVRVHVLGARSAVVRADRCSGGFPTCHRYLSLLEASYLLHRVPGYAVNRTRRLIKAPRMFWCDPGLGSHLSGIRGTDEQTSHVYSG